MTNPIPDDDPVEYNEDEELAILPDDLDDDDLGIAFDDDRPIDDGDYESDDDGERDEI